MSYIQQNYKRRKIDIVSEPNRPIYFKTNACFPEGDLDVIEGTLLFTRDNKFNKTECYTLRGIHRFLNRLPDWAPLPKFIPLGFVFAFERYKNLLTISMSNRLHVDNIWADFKIIPGENLYISKRDYLPYTQSFLTQTEKQNLEKWFWCIGCSRQTFIQGSKV